MQADLAVDHMARAAGSLVNTMVLCLRLFLHLLTFASLFLFFWYAWWWLSNGIYQPRWIAWQAKLLLPYKYCDPNQLAGSVSGDSGSSIIAIAFPTLSIGFCALV